MTQLALHAIKPAPAPRSFSEGGAPAADNELELRASLTYEPFYFLQEKPFSLAADPRFLFKSRGHAVAFDELSGAIRRREGLVVVTGEIGTGKTTLCRAVLGQLDRRTFSAFVADPFLSREDLLKILLVEYGVVSLDDLNGGRLQGWTRQELSYRLYDFLDSLVPLQAFAVLVVDEAQNLSLPLLEEIRILNDLERREKLIQVVLVGQPELRTRLKLPQLRQVEQRVAMRCELKALAREEVAAYVEHRLNVARGSASSINFSPGALDVVHHASAGVPRLINLICDRALYEAHRLNVSRRVEPAVVWKAIGALGIDVTPATAPKDPGAGLVALESTATPVAEPTRVPSPAPERGAEPRNTRDTDVMAAPQPCATVTPARIDEPIELDDEVVIDAQFRTDADSQDLQLELLLREPDAPAVPAVQVEVEGGTDSIAEFSSETDVPGQMSQEAEEQTLGGSGARRFAIAAGLALAVVSAAGVPLADDALGTWVADSIPRLPPAPVMTAPRPLKPAVVSPPPAPETFIVEVALFSTRDGADRAVQQLTAGGYTASMRELALGARRFVQVVAGAFGTRSEAETALAGIREIPGYADARVRAVSAVE